jgi:hypothetical protein
MIAKKPTPPTTSETKTQRFIRAGSVPAAPTPKRQIKPVLIGFDELLLARLDAAAAEMGLSRTAFVVMVVAERTK